MFVRSAPLHPPCLTPRLTPIRVVETEEEEEEEGEARPANLILVFRRTNTTRTQPTIALWSILVRSRLSSLFLLLVRILTLLSGTLQVILLLFSLTLI